MMLSSRRVFSIVLGSTWRCVDWGKGSYIDEAASYMIDERVWEILNFLRQSFWDKCSPCIETQRKFSTLRLNI